MACYYVDLIIPMTHKLQRGEESFWGIAQFLFTAMKKIFSGFDALISAGKTGNTINKMQSSQDLLACGRRKWVNNKRILLIIKAVALLFATFFFLKIILGCISFKFISICLKGELCKLQWKFTNKFNNQSHSKPMQ